MYIYPNRIPGNGGGHPAEVFGRGGADTTDTTLGSLSSSTSDDSL